MSVPPPPGFRLLHELLDPAERCWRRPSVVWVSGGVRHSAVGSSLHYHGQYLQAAEAACRDRQRRGVSEFWGWQVKPVDSGLLARVELPALTAWPKVRINMQRDRLAHPASGHLWIEAGECPTAQPPEIVTAEQLRTYHAGRALTLNEAVDAAYDAGFWKEPRRLPRDLFWKLIWDLCQVKPEARDYGSRTIRKLVAEREKCNSARYPELLHQ